MDRAAVRSIADTLCEFRLQSLNAENLMIHFFLTIKALLMQRFMCFSYPSWENPSPDAPEGTCREALASAGTSSTLAQVNAHVTM